MNTYPLPRQPKTFSKPARSRWIAELGRVLNALTAVVMLSDEPQIRQCTTARGTYWKIWDPTTGKRLYLNTENEVRQWLEQRYR
jgi:hypothetical protein